MSLLKQICCFLFILTGQLSFGQKLKSKMSIELSISHTREFPYIANCSDLKKVNVIIHNNTDNPQYFYEDWNSYGYYNISFEIKTKDSIYEVVRPQKLWYRNFKSHFILNPNESLVFPYLLVDTACTNKLFENRIFEDGWVGFPHMSDTVEIRAVYQLCHLEDSIPDEPINRLNYGRDFYIDFLDEDILSEPIKPNQKNEKPKVPQPEKLPDTKTILIFNEPLVSEWQEVILSY
nr:hypothetical protein [uncultured Fluviicola sp.]